MTSLLGASGEDMAVILRALGYRCESRPESEVRTTPKVAPLAAGGGASDAPSSSATDDADAAPDKSQASQPGEAATETPADAPADSDVTAASEPDLAATSAQAMADGRVPVPAPTRLSEAPSGQAGSFESPSPAISAPAPADPVPADDGPAMVEVWRIAGPRRQAGRPRRKTQQADGQAGGGQSPPAQRKTKSGSRPPRKASGKRKSGEPSGGQHKGGKPGRRGPAGRPAREQSIDPDNPFAALAALKKDLEKTSDR
jgi:ATP-dependent RNA helicase SUPV3L1/SUV3